MSKFKVGDKVKVKPRYFKDNYRKYDTYGELIIKDLVSDKVYACIGPFDCGVKDYHYKEYELDFSENISIYSNSTDAAIVIPNPLGDFTDLDIESKLNNLEEISDRELAALAAPLMDYLNRNHNPHTKIIVETDRIEIVQGIRMVKDNTHIRD